jgi:hypothetical protein
MRKRSDSFRKNTLGFLLWRFYGDRGRCVKKIMELQWLGAIRCGFRFCQVSSSRSVEDNGFI